MGFEIGDVVIHCTYGLGQIADIEEKSIHGLPTNCYVFRTADLTIWIPITYPEQHSLRIPTPPDEFIKLSTILTDPSEKLLENRLQRKDQLMSQMKDGELASICRVVRDLMNLKRSTRLSYQEKSILERAINSLLAEWTYSQGISLSKAEQAMTNMLVG